MLCRKFELLPIKIGFFMNFKVAQKWGQRPCTIVPGLWPNFTKIIENENSPFLLHFLIHIHVLMSRKKLDFK